jgi:hypothetical protein
MNTDKRELDSNFGFLIAAIFLMPVQVMAQTARMSGVTAPRPTVIAQSTVAALTPTPSPLPTFTPAASTVASPALAGNPVVPALTPTGTLTPAFVGTLTVTPTITKTGTVTPTATRTVTGTPTPTPGVFHFKISPRPVQGSLHFEWGANMQSQEVDLIVYTSSFRPVRRFIFSPDNRVDFLTPGVHEFVWNGLDEQNRPLAPGTYLCFIDIKVRKTNYEASGDFATP